MKIKVIIDLKNTTKKDLEELAKEEEIKFHSKLALLLIQAWELLFLFRDLFHSKLVLLLTRRKASFSLLLLAMSHPPSRGCSFFYSHLYNLTNPNLRFRELYKLIPTSPETRARTPATWVWTLIH